MKIKSNTIIIVVLAVVITAGVFVVLRKDKNPSIIPSQNGAVQLPENTFDTTTTIPGTRLVFSYPAKGFYGIGADVITSQADESVSRYHTLITVQSTAPYEIEKGSEFVALSFVVREQRAEERTLKDIVNALDPDSVDGQYAKFNGVYRTFNGQEFFVIKVSEDATFWGAMTLLDDDVIWIRLAYKGTEGLESQAAYPNNDRLFLQILEHISFK